MSWLLKVIKMNIFLVMYAGIKSMKKFIGLGSSALVFHQEFEEDCGFSFIPIQRISSLCIYGSLKVSME